MLDVMLFIGYQMIVGGAIGGKVSSKAMLSTVSINEILSGEKLSDIEYKEKAEENIKAALETSFSLKEKIEFFKAKWKKDHRFSLIMWIIVFAAVFVSGVLIGWYVWEKAGFVVCVISVVSIVTIITLRRGE